MYNHSMKSVLVRFPDDVYEKLAAVAEAERRNITQQILFCVEDYAEKKTAPSIPIKTTDPTDPPFTYPQPKPGAGSVNEAKD